MQIYQEQSKNIWRTWALMTGFFVVFISLGYVFSCIYDNPLIFAGMFIFSVVMNILSYWFSDKIVLGLYHAQPVNREAHPDLWNVVENLSITAGLPMPKVYIIPDAAPNAFATGRDKEHAAVAVTSGLLAVLSRTELEGVIAHELSHIGNRDILLSTVIIILVGSVNLLSNVLLHSRIQSSRDDKNGGLLAIIGIVFAILSPIAAVIIQLAISRKREYLADASAALLTRYPEGLASALEKIKNYGQGMAHPTGATAHLFIANPFGSLGQKTLTLFSTHPPIDDRIKILRGM